VLIATTAHHVPGDRGHCGPLTSQCTLWARVATVSRQGVLTCC